MPASKKKLFNLLGILITLLIIGLMAMSLLLKDSLQSAISTEIQIYGFILTFIISGILEIIPQWIAPHFLLLNNAALGFSGLASMLIVLAGSTIGALIGFQIGRKFGFGWACNLYGTERINKIKKSLNARGAWFVTIAAISPLPYIPLIFGSLGMKRRKFSLYGLLPRALGFILTWILILQNIELISNLL